MKLTLRILGTLGLAASLAFCGGTAHETRDEDDDSIATTGDKDTEPSASPSEETAVSRFVMVVPDTLRAQCQLTTNKAYFDYDSAKVEAATASFLDNVASCLTDGPLEGADVVLVGHTDPRGDEEDNRMLGLKRANAVQRYLNQHGVEATRVETLSKGEQKAYGDEPIEWMFDRRVDIRLDDDGKQAATK